MELNKYKLLKIPFISKPKSKYKFEGNAYYLINTDTYTVAWERAILSKSNYRPTDDKMLKNSKGLQTGNFKYIQNKGIDRLKLFPKSKNPLENATEDQINTINKLSLHNFNTVLGIESLITGSNPSGADSNPAASPIIFKNDIENSYIRFVNAIKRIRKHETKLSNYIKTYICEVEQIDLFFNSHISITEIMKKNEIFNNWMKIINFDIKEDEEGKKFIEKNREEIVKYIKIIRKVDIKDNVNYILKMKENDLIDKENAIKRLRREFRISLLKEAEENKWEEYSGSELIRALDAKASHILEVCQIKKNNLDLKWVADINNGFLLEATIHDLWDDDKIKINIDGSFTAVDEYYKKLETQRKVLPEVLNKQRQSFLEKREKYPK